MLPTPSRAPPDRRPATLDKIAEPEGERPDESGENRASQSEKPQSQGSPESRESDNSPEKNGSESPREEVEERRTWGRLQFKKFSEDDESDWWFASTAVPLLSATLGPLANVLSIAALVTYWRMDLVDPNGNKLGDLEGIPFRDPSWCYWLNAVSLILGFVGNFFLLMNFTQRIRYIVALPVTILLWYLATGILISALASMHAHVPPVRPDQTYTQGFWYGLSAACLYLILSMLLMINMLGCLLGHYPQKFELNDHQRTLILQTMLFFVWLAGGGAVFSRIETSQGQTGWSYADALYYCDVTILTVGFGDLAPKSDLGRGLVFPFSVGGIIMLGLVISSIHYFVAELGTDKVVKSHFEKRRQRTFGRTVANSVELRRREAEQKHIQPGDISGPSNPVNVSQARRVPSEPKTAMGQMAHRAGRSMVPKSMRTKKNKLVLLREEKDRFEEMRRIQQKTGRFKSWWALVFSVAAFGILWAVGAVAFWQCEKDTQGMTYFQALYFCYVSLLTIGYGDLSPKSNPGRCFFVVWSLIAVPTMTVLISDMGDTVIKSFKKATWRLADFTVLPKSGIWRSFLDKFPAVLGRVQQWEESRARKKRRRKGIPAGPPDEAGVTGAAAAESEELDIAEIAARFEEEEARAPSEHELARRLTVAIRKAAVDLAAGKETRYSYKEWVEVTRLIRFTTQRGSSGREDEEEVEEVEEDLVEWDWIGEDSPMVAGVSEPEFVLDRLCESMKRYIGRQAGSRLDS